jgi:phytoene dehydrogenase-like protein
VSPAASVVGAGPNGLAAAAVLARAGLDVTVFEAADEAGGAVRTAEILGDGIRSDLGASSHPTGIVSPVFRALDLASRGLTWLHPDITMGHPLEGRPAALLHRGIDRTAGELGVDGPMWKRIFRANVRNWDRLAPSVLGPLLRVPPHPVALARFGLFSALPALAQVRALFRTDRARALFAGSSLHGTMPLTHPLTSAFGTLFGTAGQASGWPFAAGGSQAITDALLADLTAHGGRVVTGTHVTDLRQVRPADVVLLDLTPRQVLALDGLHLAPRERRAFRAYRYGTAAHVVHLLLDGPIPWTDPALARAGTVHVGGTVAEIAEAEAQAASGILPDRPFVLVTQPSTADPSRAPAGQHVVWAYAHVPHGCSEERAGELVLAQIERFAPGVRDRVRARVDMGPAALEAMDPNLVGGDIGGGSLAGTQQIFRPTVSLDPYRLTADGVFLASSSTPPGGGAHGMAGYHSARRALRALHLELPKELDL